MFDLPQRSKEEAKEEGNIFCNLLQKALLHNGHVLLCELWNQCTRHCEWNLLLQVWHRILGSLAVCAGRGGGGGRCYVTSRCVG